MNIVAPSSHDVRSMNYVIPIVPRVTGQVTEVPIEPNRPIKKGDVLFKIDPVPFQQAYEAAEAKLAELKVGLITAEAYQRGLDDELKNAEASTQALVARLDLAKKRVEQFTALATTGAGRRAEQEQSESDVANFTSQIAAAKATESKIKQKIERGPRRAKSTKWRRPRRRLPKPKPTSSLRNTTSKARPTLRRPTGAWPTSRCVPACAPPSLRPCRS